MKILKKIAVFVLVFSMLLIYGCNGDNGNTNTPVTDGNTTEKITYTVKVQTPFNTPVEDILVYVHKGDADVGLVGMGVRTDAEGIATFTLDKADDYSVQLDKVPEKYIAKSGKTRADRYPMGENGVTVTLEKNPDYSPSVYALGDTVRDFTLTDVNGTEYKLSELLSSKKAVVLNFWYNACNPCAREFPHINAAYKLHKDTVEVLAINDNGDSVSSVVEYANNKGLEMPVFCVNPNSSPINLNKFEDTGAWPTTVIIDRYGTVCFIHTGAITSTDAWDNAFNYFESDSYVQSVFTDINAIPKI